MIKLNNPYLEISHKATKGETKNKKIAQRIMGNVITLIIVLSCLRGEQFL